MLLGVLILALPITVVGSNFQRMVEIYQEESGLLQEFDVDEDGMIDVDELRQFIWAKRKDNSLRRDVDLVRASLSRGRPSRKKSPGGCARLWHLVRLAHPACARAPRASQHPERLMNKYDPQNNGLLSFSEFSALKRDIVDPAAADPQANMRILLKRTQENDRAVTEMQEQLARVERMLLSLGAKDPGPPPPPPPKDGPKYQE